MDAVQDAFPELRLRIRKLVRFGATPSVKKHVTASDIAAAKQATEKLRQYVRGQYMSQGGGTARESASTHGAAVDTEERVSQSTEQEVEPTWNPNSERERVTLERLDLRMQKMEAMLELLVGEHRTHA